MSKETQKAIDNVFEALSKINPDNLIIFFARSSIFTGFPISNIKTSPPFPIDPASKTS